MIYKFKIQYQFGSGNSSITNTLQIPEGTVEIVDRYSYSDYTSVNIPNTVTKI